MQCKTQGGRGLTMSAHHLDLDLPRRPKSPSNKAVGAKERLGFRESGLGEIEGL